MSEVENSRITWELSIPSSSSMSAPVESELSVRQQQNHHEKKKCGNRQVQNTKMLLKILAMMMAKNIRDEIAIIKFAIIFEL